MVGSFLGRECSTWQASQADCGKDSRIGMLLAEVEGHDEFTMTSSQLVSSGAIGADMIHAGLVVELYRLSLLRI